MPLMEATKKNLGACVYVWSADCQGQIVASVAYRRLYGISIGFSSIKAKTETNAVGLRHWFEELRGIPCIALPNMADKRSNLSCAMMLHMDY